MLERKRNLSKNARKRKAPENNEPCAKKRAVAKPSRLLQRYPVKVNARCVDDEQCIDRHLKAIKEEMEKARPRDTLLLPLMKSTFSTRRSMIQFEEDKCVLDILKEYPPLSRPAVVSHVYTVLHSCIEAERMVFALSV